VLISNAASRRRRGRDYRCAAALAAVLAGWVGVLWAPQPAAAAQGAESAIVTVAFVPTGTGPAELAAVEGISPGLMSAGLGSVPAGQTYLDIGQGNRVFDSLYDRGLPPLLTVDGRVPPVLWRAVLARARSAPADIVPGLLATTLKRAGGFATAADVAGSPGLTAVGRGGGMGRRTSCAARECLGMTVTSVEPARLERLARRLSGNDLLIAIERPPPSAKGEQLSIGIAGAGFDGELTSDSTRLDGLVLSTDVAPTVLERVGVEIPDAISGAEIRAGGAADPARLVSLEDRMAVIGPRRGPVIGVSLLIWVALTALVAVTLGARGARVALALLALSGIYLPAVLLAGAAIEPSQALERLLVAVGCPILAVATLLVARGLGAVAIACALTVLAYAIDVVAGSPLTTLSLIGPNPGLGVRFFGIGNELEAAVATLVPIGVGAGLTAAGIGSARSAALAFAGAALVGLLVFAPGRFGADVGAAVVLPVGAAVAAWVVLGGGPRRLLLVPAIPLLALAAVVAIDLLLGGDAHLSRSVLEAGGLDDVAEVLERRLRLSAGSFARNLDSPSMFACVALIVAGLVLRRHIATWFEGRRPALAGLVGAIAATVAGTLANDSGALVLMIGTGFVSLFIAFAYGESFPRRAPLPLPRDWNNR
jgi:hypothetical protein